MELEESQVRSVDTEYWRYEAAEEAARASSASPNLPPYENNNLDSREEPVIPSRYRTRSEGDSTLEKDLIKTANGGRRTRRTTRRSSPHFKIDADTEFSDDSSIDEGYEVASILSSIDERLSWRGRMQQALHNHFFHIFIVVLVCLDAAIVLFELLLDVGALDNRDCSGETEIEQSEFCHYDTQGRCGPLAFMILQHRNISATRGHGNTDLCVCHYNRGRYVCADANEANGINPGEALHIASLVILSIFLLEIILKMVAFRLKYFTHKFEVFDGVIVVISFVLDIASIIEEEAFETAAQFIIILRLWRVVRIVNGAILSSKTNSDRKLEEARKEARRIIHAFHKCQDKLDEVEGENAKLLKQMELHKGPVAVKKPNKSNKEVTQPTEY